MTIRATGRQAAWEAVRDDRDIQFAPVDTPPPQPPAWLDALIEFLRSLRDAAAELVGPYGTTLVWIVAGLAAALALYLSLRIFWPVLQPRLAAESEPDAQWSPPADEARALIAEADRLAAEGRYEEAVRLLLKRSVSQIDQARPGSVTRSTTARELAALPALSQAAREAFGVIADGVERSLFALRSLGDEDWQAARAAYARFAAADLA